jgi:hypothetical protein
MTSTDDQPTLLPGVSARTWRVVVHVATGVAITAAVVASIPNWLGSGTGFTFAWYIPMIVALLLVYSILFILGVRTKSEVAAGYTTLARGNVTVPQLDPRTGVILRKAGESYLPKASRFTRDVHDYAPERDRSSSPSPWAGIRSFWYILLIAVVASSRFPLRGGWLALVFLGTLALFAVIYGAIALVAHRRLRRLREAAPASLAFLFSKSSELEPALERIGWSQGEWSATTGVGASADAGGLTIWLVGPPTNGVAVSWSEIVSIQPDQFTVGNRSLPGVLIVVTAPDGSLVALPLAHAIVTPFPSASRAGVAWIVARLDELRAGRSVARLI